MFRGFFKMFVRFKDVVFGGREMEWSRNVTYFKHLRSRRKVTTYSSF